MIDDLPFTSEEDVELASEDYFEPEGRPPIKPGRYLSKSRELTAGVTSKGNACVNVKFGPFQSLKGEDVRDFPPFETLYFNKRKAFRGTGEISAVGAYLKACGLRYNTLSDAELKEELNKSENIPVVVVVGWKQDFKELAEGEKPQYTKFFRNDDGSYTHQKQVDGKTYTARARVEMYEKVKS